MPTRVSLPSLLSISCSLPLFLSLCTPFNLFTPSDLHSKSSLPSGKIWTPRGSKSQKPIRLNTSCSHRRLLAHWRLISNPPLLPLFPWLSPGQWYQYIDEQETGAACAIHGGDYGDLLPVVLAAVRHHGPAGHLRSAWPGHTRGEHHPVSPGQDEYGHQPGHLCLHE